MYSEQRQLCTLSSDKRLQTQLQTLNCKHNCRNSRSPYILNTSVHPIYHVHHTNQIFDTNIWSNIKYLINSQIEYLIQIFVHRRLSYTLSSDTALHCRPQHNKSIRPPWIFCPPNMSHTYIRNYVHPLYHLSVWTGPPYTINLEQRYWYIV